MKKVLCILSILLIVLLSASCTPTTTTATLPPVTVTLPQTTVTLPQVTITLPQITLPQATTTLPAVTTTNMVTTTAVTTSVVTTTSPPVTTTQYVSGGVQYVSSPPVTTTVITTQPPVTSTVTTTVPPVLTYSTSIHSDIAVTGSLTNGIGNFAITTGRVTTNPPTMHTLTLAGTTSSGLQANGMFPFYLQATPTQKTSLLSYFGTMAGNVAYQTQIDNEVNGTVPFLYLSTTNGLVDGFRYALGAPASSAALTINDDYPLSAYLYTGTLIGSNNAILSVSITLTVN